jgi:hypothetical protein
MDLHQRLTEFFRRLEAAPPAASAQEGLDLVCRLIEEVEDELCPLPRECPPPLHLSGRMYPPQEDRVKRVRSGAIKADTRQHRIFCRPGGAILIFHLRTRSFVFQKQGRHERAT